MKLSNAVLQQTAVKMSARFSAIVCATGSLQPAQMRTAIVDARRDGVDVPNLVSERSLQIVNSYYSEV